jgi:hypothetical protein
MCYKMECYHGIFHFRLPLRVLLSPRLPHDRERFLEKRTTYGHVKF